MVPTLVICPHSAFHFLFPALPFPIEAIVTSPVPLSLEYTALSVSHRTQITLTSVLTARYRFSILISQLIPKYIQPCHWGTISVTRTHAL